MESRYKKSRRFSRPQTAEKQPDLEHWYLEMVRTGDLTLGRKVKA